MRVHHIGHTLHAQAAATEVQQDLHLHPVRQLADRIMAEGITQPPTEAAIPAKPTHTTRTDTTGIGSPQTVTVFINDRIKYDPWKG